MPRRTNDANGATVWRRGGPKAPRSGGATGKRCTGPVVQRSSGAEVQRRSGPAAQWSGEASDEPSEDGRTGSVEVGLAPAGAAAVGVGRQALVHEALVQRAGPLVPDAEATLQVGGRHGTAGRQPFP